MKRSALLGLSVVLLNLTPQVTAGGTLDFLPLSSYSSVYGDSGYSTSISTMGGFPFGTETIYNVYVSSDGYISMGVSPLAIPSSPTIPDTISIVAPYAADIDPSIRGTVRYTLFTTSDSSDRNRISSFIRSQTSNFFYGTRMMVAEWKNVPTYYGSSFLTSTFQCVLITDGSASYAVFIYDCGGMEWSGATIGWAASSTMYEEHSLSGSSSSSLIGCLYSSTYSAVVYRLDRDCNYDEFMCDNGKCVPQSSVCDGDNDCWDNSDEDQNCCDFECSSGECVSQSSVCDGYNDCWDHSDEDQNCCYGSFKCNNGDCVNEDYVCDTDDDCGDSSDEEGCGYDSEELNVGLVVGLSVGLFSLLAFVSVPIIAVVVIYYVSRRKRIVQTRVVSTTPSAGVSSVVTSRHSTASYTPLVMQDPNYEDNMVCAPPSYEDACSALPVNQEYQPNPSLVKPPQQSTTHSLATEAPPGYHQVEAHDHVFN